MSFLRRALPPDPMDPFDEVRYVVCVHLPHDQSAPPKPAKVEAAVCAALNLPQERVQVTMTLPWMGG